MTITAKLADGTELQFPDGTDPAVVQRTVQSLIAQNANPAADKTAMQARVDAARANGITPARAAQQAAIDKPVEQDLRDPGALSAFASGASQGLTFGFGDEITAGMAAVNPFDSMGYDQALKAIRGQNENAAFARPKTEMAGQIAGALVPALAGGGVSLGSAATIPGRMGMGAVAGAVEGGAYGFGTGEGGVANRGLNAAKMAAVGAGAGAAAPAAMAGLRMAGNAVKNPAMNLLNIGSETQAGAALQTYMQRAGMTMDDVMNAIRGAGREGQPEYAVADALGASGQRALSGVTRQPGEARQVVTDALNLRQANQGYRVSGFVDDALNAPNNLGKTAAQVEAEMTKARGATANVAYDAARTGANPVDVRGALGVIDGRIGGMQGSNIAGDGIDAKLSRFRGRLAAPTESLPQGTTARELSDFDRVLGVKQEVQDAIGEAVRAGRNNEARELGKLQSELDAALEGASSAYRGANDQFAKASREIDAIGEGAAATKNTVRYEDSTARYGAMTPEQQTAFRAGYSDPIQAKIASQAPGADKARPLMDTKNTVEFGAMARDPELLQRQLGRESTMFETRNAALGGSKTADNLADSNDTAAQAASVVMNIISGRWGAAGGQVADKAISAMKGQSPKTRELIARMLISQDPQAALIPAIRKAANIGQQDAVIGAISRAGAVRAIPQ